MTYGELAVILDSLRRFRKDGRMGVYAFDTVDGMWVEFSAYLGLNAQVPVVNLKAWFRNDFPFWIEAEARGYRKP